MFNSFVSQKTNNISTNTLIKNKSTQSKSTPLAFPHATLYQIFFFPYLSPLCHSLKTGKLWHETKEKCFVHLAACTLHYIKGGRKS